MNERGQTVFEYLMNRKVWLVLILTAVSIFMLSKNFPVIQESDCGSKDYPIQEEYCKSIGYETYCHTTNQQDNVCQKFEKEYYKGKILRQYEVFSEPLTETSPIDMETPFLKWKIDNNYDWGGSKMNEEKLITYNEFLIKVISYVLIFVIGLISGTFIRWIKNDWIVRIRIFYYSWINYKDFIMGESKMKIETITILILGTGYVLGTIILVGGIIIIGLGINIHFSPAWLEPLTGIRSITIMP